MTEGTAISRRERYRRETIEEAKRIAGEQLAELGPGGISVNAIAKRMGVTGPALYRYFASRDDLLTALILDGYELLAGRLEAAVAGDGPAPDRFRRVCAALREWALEEPQRYLLLFGTPVPGYRAPEDTRAAAQRTMRTVAGAVAGLPVPAADPRWAAVDERFASVSDPAGASPVVARRALLTWTRLHGVLSLEVEGQFEGMAVDPESVFRAEVEGLLGD